MIFKIPKLIARLIGISYLIWIILSTAIPQILIKYTNSQIQLNKYEPSKYYPYNSITSPTPLPLKNSTVYFIIGHPDDEVMFFSPSMIEISKPKHNNKVKLICFSRGDAVDDSFGNIRSQELIQLARIIGINENDVITLNDYKDGMSEHWDSLKIGKSLNEIIDLNSESPNILITFDEFGVSNHPNHISLYHGTKKYYESIKSNNDVKLYVLKSLNFIEKYSFTLLTIIELFVDHLSRLFDSILKININISFFSNNIYNKSSSIKFYSDLNMLSVGYAAMAYGHFSQMVWFRYGWLIFSRYLTFNHLIEVD